MSIPISCRTRSSRPAPATSSSASANDGTFRKLAKEIGKPELGTDPRFARNKDRIANRDALRDELAAVFSLHDAEPLCNRLLAAGLPAGPVQSIDQALTNAHTLHRGDVIEKDWYKASPPRSGWREQAEPAPDPAEIQPAHRRSAGRVRLFQERDRGTHRHGRGSAAPSGSAEVSCRCAASGTRDAVFAYLTASPRGRFPIPCFRLYGHLYVIRRCYRAKPKMTTQPGGIRWYFDNSA